MDRRNSFGNSTGIKMKRDAIKNILYGGLSELTQNSHYYYRSPISSEYCYWTEEGEKAMVEFVSMVSSLMADADQAQLDTRAKELVMDGLTK